tara:strand:+ start:57 stop:776 length:720 start_codon:yes stop_codon:yes gene_type:complete
MKNIEKNFYILTISKNDLKGLNKTIRAVNRIKTNFKLIHIVKIFNLNSETIETIESRNLKRIIINSYDSGIYNSMNTILERVPNNEYAIFLNSGDIIKGELDLNYFSTCKNFYLINTYKEKYFKRNLIKIKNTFFDGMPFSHQSLIFKKKFGMYFSEDYEICGDYEFIIKWLKKYYKYPAEVDKIYKVKTIFDINGISSKRRLKRDFEGYKVILRSCGIFKSLIYLTNRFKSYLRILIY